MYELLHPTLWCSKKSWNLRCRYAEPGSTGAAKHQALMSNAKKVLHKMAEDFEEAFCHLGTETTTTTTATIVKNYNYWYLLL